MAAEAMKKSRAYVPWFQGDFLRSTNGWPLLTKAIYWQLLCAQWEQGPLPNNPEWLARIAGCTQSEFDAGWATIASKFAPTNTGLVNERMAEHAANWERYQSQQAANGRKGGQTTQQRQREKRDDNVVVDFAKKERV